MQPAPGALSIWFATGLKHKEALSAISMLIKTQKCAEH
jgi:hypothetical protein